MSEEESVPAESTSSSAPPPAPVSSAPAPTTSSSSGRSNKSKKKKNSGGGGNGNGGANGQGENTGRWTAEEHRLFLQGLEQHGKGWKKIASLIKSRTVVQIRTHAQKYFQKLAKARQNGEEGEITMEGRGGLSITGAGAGGAGGIGGGAGHHGSLMTGGGYAGGLTAAQAKRRRLPLAGTKRKAIASVVHSAQKQGKKMAGGSAGTGKVVPPPLPAVAPTLANFVLPATSTDKSNGGFAAQGNLPASALEDSIFRFLTPAPVVATDAPVLNEVARSAGANPITVPSDKPNAASGSGEVSPTGVAEISIYSTWIDTKDAPSWYAKGADVDALLDVAGSLDWLVDSGDPTESFTPPVIDSARGEEIPVLDVSPSKVQAREDAASQDVTVSDAVHGGVSSGTGFSHVDSSNFEHHLATISSSAELPQTMDDANMDEVVPPLPSIFGGGTDSDNHYGEETPAVSDPTPSSDTIVPASNSAMNLLLTPSPSNAKLSLKDDDHEHASPTVHHVDLADATLFHDSEMEHDFVSTILEENSGSAVDLSALNSES